MEENGIIKIGVIGAESTGKTWLCSRLAKHFNTVWVPEYAREYFNHSDIYNYSINDLIIIARKQIELEKEHLARANKLLFCDTTLITLKIWSELEFNCTPPEIQTLMIQHSYNHYLITNNDIPWESDSLRQNKHSRDLLFELNLLEVKKSMTPFTVVKGNDEARIETAINYINKL